MSLPKPLPDAAAADEHTLADEREYEELTLDSQLNLQYSPLPSPTIGNDTKQDPFRRSNTLTFPKLESDGSLSDLRDASPPTTPTHNPTNTFTSFGDRDNMAEHSDMEGSVASIDSEYDFVDDASTASLGSTNDGDKTPADENGDDCSYFKSESVEDLARTSQAQNVNTDAYKDAEEENDEANRILDSYMSEDLETPRQSTICTLPTNGVRISLYSVPDGASSQLAPKVGARIATCIADAHEGSCQTFTLPATPDNSQGSLLCRCGNTDVIVRALSKLHLHMPDPSAPDMVVIRLHGDDPPESLSVIDMANFQAEIAGSEIPVVVIAKNEEIMAGIKDKIDYGMLTTDDEFFHGDEEITGEDLRSLVARSRYAGTEETTSASQKQGGAKMTTLLAWMNRSSTLMRMAFGALILALLIPSLILPYITHGHSNAMTIEDKRDLLRTSFQAWGDQAPRYDNLEEVIAALLPDREPNAKLEAASLLVQPNRMLVSVHGSHIINVEATGVIRKPDETIDFNTTKILDHVYTIDIPLREAHGLVEYNMVVQQPGDISFKIEHEFGRRVWQRSTYQKAGTDLAKAINKDVAVARTAAKTLTDRIGLEFSASAAATQNITTQLVVRMSSELQVFSKGLRDVIGEIISKSAAEAEHNSKHVAVTSKELIRCLDDVKKSLATTALSIKDLIIPTRETFTKPFELARKRAQCFKDAVAAPEDDTSTETEGKEKQWSALVDYFAKVVDRGSDKAKGQDGDGGREDEKKECKDCR